MNMFYQEKIEPSTYIPVLKAEFEKKLKKFSSLDPAGVSAPENLYLEIGEFPKIGKKCLKIGHNMGKAEVRSPRVNR